jgi:hypothetical protein
MNWTRKSSKYIGWNKIMKDTCNTCARRNGVQIEQLKYDPYPTLQYLQMVP